MSRIFGLSTRLLSLAATAVIFGLNLVVSGIVICLLVLGGRPTAPQAKN